MRSLKGEATASRIRRSRDEPVFDIISAVKGLHELNSEQLSKLIRDSGSNIIEHIAEHGILIQIDVEKFARHLPRHFIAVIMSWERDKSTFKYLLCGILLLHAMCDPTARVPKIEQILLDDVKVSEELIDMVFYLLVVLGTYRQENHHAPNDMILLHSALVACSLKLLTVVISPQFEEVAQVLTAYYKVDMFMDAAFAAACIDVKVLQEKLSAEHAEASANTSPTHEETLIHLFQQCDCSLKFMQSFCEQKLFRERIVKNKELCGNGGVLLMVHAVMNLKLSPLYSMSPSHMASVSRLKSKALSILLHMCDAQTVSYLDEVANNELSQKLAKSIAIKVLDLLKKTFGVDSKTTSSEIVNLKGQLELNSLRLADFFSDDSNFRSFIKINFTETLAAIFMLPHGEFLSGWCSSNLPNCDNDASLDVPWESYAYHITSLLIKVIANLHCYVPDLSKVEKNFFLSMFLRCLEKNPQSHSDVFSSEFDTQKIMKVRKNLCSLLSHAESLVPRFLNDEDVKLLRLFSSQFEGQMNSYERSGHASAASGDPIVQTELAANHNAGDINIEDGLTGNVTNQEVGQLIISRNGSDQYIDGDQHEPIGASIHLVDTDGDARMVETSGSDSSPTRGKNDRRDSDRVRGSGFEETFEDEKIDAMHSDERQQRKRKRTVMNDKQIALIESVLVKEPDMHRNSASLQTWSEELSCHGAEVTTSRLKNWLNNRKARLARVAKDVRGDTLERQGGSGQFDSPQSPMDAPFAGGGSRNEVKDSATKDSVDENSRVSLFTPMGGINRSGPHFEPGQYVLLLGDKSEEIGRGKIFQVNGKWFGRSLEESRKCVVDIFDLKVDRFSNLLNPSEVTGNSFDQAEKRFGLIRVLWDLDKVFLIMPPHSVN